MLFHVLGLGIAAEAKIKLLSTDTVTGAMKKYREKGVFLNESEMRQYQHNGLVTTYLLTNVKKYPETLSAADTRAIVSDVDFQGQVVTQDHLDQIREVAKNDSSLY